MSKWSKFFQCIQQDLKLFFFTWLLLCLFRIVFVGLMSNYMSSGADASDLWLNTYYGMKMSLKSAGVIMGISFFFCTLPHLLFAGQWASKLRLMLGSGYIVIICLLFFARFAYYEEFHVGFNQFVFNAVNDDVGALFMTIVDQYQLAGRLAGAIFLSAIFSWLLKKVLATKTFAWQDCNHQLMNYAKRVGFVLLLLVFGLFARFGGSFGYASSIHWENCAKTKDDFLNEMILDDIQAMYRGYSINERINHGRMTGVEKDNIKEFAARISQSSIDHKTLDDCLVHKASGAVIAKPNKIFIIIGESYAQWPLLKEYEYLNLYPNLRRLVAAKNADSITAFLPNGAFTPMAVNAIISGLSDVNVYPNQQAESYKSVYASGLAPQMKKLGYKTEFWYAGFSSWERIKDFALAQEFDDFYSCADYPFTRGNVWGCDDTFMFQALSKKLRLTNEPTVSVVLTVSNHAPYSIDVVSEGFPKEAVRALLPEDCQQNEDLLNRLGHLWYTDKMIGEFIAQTERDYPDSLFIITGDHADRTNIDRQPSLFERYTVPFVLYGQGIHQGILPENAAGSHVNIIPTLLELIAPKDFAYYAIGDSLTKQSSVGFNHNVWMTNKAIGKIDDDNVEILDSQSIEGSNERNKAMGEMKLMRTIAWWRTMRGNELE